MISNSNSKSYDIIEITNELPINRLGGVGSVIENLKSGFKKLNINILWFVVDHPYNKEELNYILKNYDNVVIGSYKDISNFNAPVVHLHTYNSNPDIFNYLKNKKVIYTIHSLLICEAVSNDIDMTPSIRKQEKMIASCNEIVLVSEAEKRWYYKYNYQKLNPNVHVIYNGLKPPVSDLDRQYQKKKNIGFCGRLVPRKRPEYVHMLLNEKEFKDCSVYIAGRGFSPYAKKILEKNNLHGRVHYLGWCGGARLEAFYNTINVLAITSIYEPFGMVALEAISRGIPVVCNPIGGLTEIMEDNAFYTNGTAYKDFRLAMQEWLNADYFKIKKKSEGAYQQFHNNFTDIKMAQNYANLIAQKIVL